MVIINIENEGLLYWMRGLDTAGHNSLVIYKACLTIESIYCWCQSAFYVGNTCNFGCCKCKSLICCCGYVQSQIASWMTVDIKLFICIVMTLVIFWCYFDGIIPEGICCSMNLKSLFRSAP